MQPAFDFSRPYWVDTHCHLDEFVAHGGQAHADAMREDARRAGVAHCVIPAVERSNWSVCRDLAHRWGDSYALGIHPLFTPDAREADIAELGRALAEGQGDPRLVAVGEIGLDYFVPGLDSGRQEHFYREQLQLARRFGLPVIVHVRRSADRLLKHLRELPVVGGIAHAFNGSLQQARVFIDMGFKLGFGGALTFERALQLRRLAEQLPVEALVLETDSPDIPPHWLYVTAQQREAGVPQARNTPAELPRIAEVLAGLRGLDARELARVSVANAVAALPKLAPFVAQGTEAWPKNPR
ncbi:TatD family hydrolase [Diaphorobacter aerolatus]|uniref:TatD family hydrolase n=1 Tax=Diaphorobacter aerolatus TaxID=1288495 RepID=A0A7H0GND6_9BURK|nr:TatD family hydrolase [Diaphorobacter aerolatus]QNP49802.1 TatD family hydrolase [Diaphorobacter aerolatus]